MTLSWNTIAALPRLYTYADADRRERETKPVRGDEQQRKPLGRRNQKWRHIKREADNSVSIYITGWMQNPLPTIRFYPNGEIHVLSYPYSLKATENEVIEAVLGTTVYTEQRKAWIKHVGGESPLREAPKPVWCRDTGTYLASTTKPEASIFVRNERNGLVLLNPPKLTTHVVSRKAANQVRERYAEGIAYVRAMSKLRRDNLPKWEEMVEAFPERFEGVEAQYHWQRREAMPRVMDGHRFKHEHAAIIVNLLASTTPADQYKAYLWLQNGVGAGDEYVSKAIDRVLMLHHHDEWFVEREVLVGEKKHDRYAWAFPKEEPTT